MGWVNPNPRFDCIGKVNSNALGVQGTFKLPFFFLNKETEPQHWRTRKQYSTQVTRPPHRGAC